MNRFELLDELDRLKVPSTYYSIKGAMNDRVCLDFDDKNWIVYYIEKGQKSILGVYNSENDACLYMLEKLKGGM